MFPFNDITEPKLDLLVCTFNRVRTVANVSSSDNAVISSDSTGVGSQRIGGSEHKTASSNYTDTFPNHANDGAWQHVVDESREKGSSLEIGVVLFKEFLGGLNHLEGSEVVSSLFEAGDDFSNESSLDTVRLNHDVASFHVVESIIVKSTTTDLTCLS